MDLEYSLTDSEIKIITNYAIMKLKDKPKLLPLVRINSIRALRDLREQDISIEEDGIYLNDVDILLRFSKLEEIDSFKNIIKINIDNCNLYIPLRVFSTEEEKNRFLEKINSITNEETEEFFDENNFIIRAITGKRYYNYIKNQENKLNNLNRIKLFYIIFCILLSLEYIALIMLNIAYGLDIVHYGYISGIMGTTFITYIAAIKINAKKTEVRLKKSELKEKFKVDIKIDNESMTIIEDGKEFCYDLKDIVKVEEKSYGLLVHYKFKKKYKQLIIGQMNKSEKLKVLLKNKLTSVAEANELIEDVTKYEKRRKINGVIFAVIGVALLVNLIAYDNIPKRIEKYMPKTYNELINHRVEYEKEKQRKAILELLNEVNNVLEQVSESNKNK